MNERPPFTAEDREIVEIGGSPATLVPLERMVLRATLSGADGENRSPAFAYIHARNDLEAVRAYLYQYPRPAENRSRIHEGTRAFRALDGVRARQSPEFGIRRGL